MSRLKVVTNESLSGMEESGWPEWLNANTRMLECWPVVMAPTELGDSAPRGTIELELRLSDVGYYYLCIGAEDGGYIKAWFMGEDFAGWTATHHFQPLGHGHPLDPPKRREATEHALDPRPGGTCRHERAMDYAFEKEEWWHQEEVRAARHADVEAQKRAGDQRRHYLDMVSRMLEDCDCAV